MTTVTKKVFVELVAFLQENENKKVSTLMPTIIEMVSGKSSAKTFIKDDEGNVIAIYCYYHKKWEVLSEVEYGAKASSSTGFNTMCKEGVSNWTKQQRVAKTEKSDLLESVSKGEIVHTELTDKLALIEERRNAIIAIEHGFDSEDEAIQFHNS